MSKALSRLRKIKSTIEDIEFILQELDFKVTNAIEDKLVKPALRMHIVKVAEQFSKLKEENEFKTLENFTARDLRGISAVRNFIAHDYDSVDEEIIEDVLRLNLPAIKAIVEKVLAKANSA